MCCLLLSPLQSTPILVFLIYRIRVYQEVFTFLDRYIYFTFQLLFCICIQTKLIFFILLFHCSFNSQTHPTRMEINITSGWLENIYIFRISQKCILIFNHFHLSKAIRVEEKHVMRIMEYNTKIPKHINFKVKLSKTQKLINQEKSCKKQLKKKKYLLQQRRRVVTFFCRYNMDWMKKREV